MRRLAGLVGGQAAGSSDPALRPPPGRVRGHGVRGPTARERQAALHRCHRRHRRQDSPQQPDSGRGDPARAAPRQTIVQYYRLARGIKTFIQRSL